MNDRGGDHPAWTHMTNAAIATAMGSAPAQAPTSPASVTASHAHSTPDRLAAPILRNPPTLPPAAKNPAQMITRPTGGSRPGRSHRPRANQDTDRQTESR